MKNILFFIFFLGTFSIAKAEDADEEILSEMRKFRNEIFARKGRKFKSTDLQEYFNTKSWYKPINNFDSKCLSPKENLAVKTIKQIEESFTELTKEDKNQTVKIFNFIKNNVFNSIDTTLLTIAKIDNFEGKDTVITRIHEIEYGTFCIDYTFIKNGKEVWKESVSNPYLWLGNHELFDKWENHFFIGYIAINFCQAKSEQMWQLPVDQSILEIGLHVIKYYGQNVELKEYELYINNFKGDLVLHSFSETGGKLEIWYEPLKRFITFYAP